MKLLDHRGKGSGVKRRLGALVVVACALAVGTLASTAWAASPILLRASQENRVPIAVWQLPPNVEPSVAEVATNPATDSLGYFIGPTVFETLATTQTSWKASRSIEPGTYYLHIGGFDRSCFTCPVREW